ncbi:MAG: Gx transporter family protein [Lachnospiraceae bacterium]|nr:Gx transporter family protein [Lachnospiraceae bacterium]
MNTKKLAALSLLTAIALVIYILESMIPPLVPVPGIKLGLANVITLFVLVYYGAREAAMVLTVRVILSSIFVGQITYFFYSVAGAAAAFLIMWLFTRINRKRFLWFTGAMGGIFHNLGQILVAVLIMGSPYILSYFPFLMISGIITGLFTGTCVQLLIKRKIKA